MPRKSTVYESLNVLGRKFVRGYVTVVAPGGWPLASHRSMWSEPRRRLASFNGVTPDDVDFEGDSGSVGLRTLKAPVLAGSC